MPATTRNYNDPCTTRAEGNYALPVLQAVEWARSKRGEWQPPGAGDGCVRFGLCETEAEGRPSESNSHLHHKGDQ